MALEPEMHVVKNLLRAYIKTAFQADPTLMPGDYHPCEEDFLGLLRLFRGYDSSKLAHSVNITTGAGTVTIVMTLDPTPQFRIDNMGPLAWANSKPPLPFALGGPE